MRGFEVVEVVKLVQDPYMRVTVMITLPSGEQVAGELRYISFLGGLTERGSFETLVYDVKRVDFQR
jgi:hypothetical protein